MKALIMFLFLTLFFVSPSQIFADDSPVYAGRGMTAYQAGKYDLAKMFFTKALQDAVLKGREEWILKATLNLVDLDLEMLDVGEASHLLEASTPHSLNDRALILWKKSQLAFEQRQFSSASALIDSAITFSKKGDASKTRVMELDRLHYLVQTGTENNWQKDYQEFNSQKGKLDKGRVASLEALVAMSQKEWGRADTLWEAAVSYFRDKGRLAKMAASLNQSAICKFSEGHREEAQEMNARSVAIFTELGLEIPGLRAQALRLLLIENPRELAKIHQEMDLLGQRFGGFDLQGILDEYTRSLQYGRIGVGP